MDGVELFHAVSEGDGSWRFIIAIPATELVLRRRRLRRGKLLAARLGDVEDGIDDVAQVGLAGPPTWVDRDFVFDQVPLFVGDVAGIGLCSHTSLYAFLPPYGTVSKPQAVILLIQLYRPFQR